MRKIVGFMGLLVLTACTVQGSNPSHTRQSHTRMGTTGSNVSLAGTPTVTSTSLVQGAVARATLADKTPAFSNAPDRGSLVQYPKTPVVRAQGAYAWHMGELSEDHALRSIATGNMTFTAPDGTSIPLTYERHVEHPDGNWSWFGRAQGDSKESAVITFGQDATFGIVPQNTGLPLRLTVKDGKTWIVETNPKMVKDLDGEATDPTSPDFLVPPKLASLKASAQKGVLMSDMQAVAMTVNGRTVLDVMVGYTTGFASNLGGNSAAVTRAQNLVAITNQAYVNSQINAEVRLVHSMPVNYPDATDNGVALEEMSGFKAPSTKTTPNAAFNDLRAAREQYGADLVVLLRRFQDPENDGCGIAWLLGGNQTGIDQSDEYFGYSVVSDGQDMGTDGKTYFCRDETFAHELGHNLGSQHDIGNAKNSNGTTSFGVFAYSFGYKAPLASGNFFTVMAYGDQGQAIERVFSNPRIAVCGTNKNAPCGTDSADNARSINNTIATVASFRATVVAPSPPPPVAPPSEGRLNLYSINRQGPNGTEAHILSGIDYQSFVKRLNTALHPTGRAFNWRFQVGDYNRDGVLDIYAIAKQGGSNTTEIHVLNGADNFQSFLLHVGTALHQTGDDNTWVFKLGDYNRDGILDMYTIGRSGNSGSTEVHVLNGATQYTSFLAHLGTALHVTGSDSSWDFALGDYNKDGTIDLYTFSKLGASGTTEVHVLNGASNFQNFLVNSTSALHGTGSDQTWSFKVGDYNNDGVLDVYSINKVGQSGKTEVHVLNGANRYQSFLAHIATALHATDEAWEFELGN